MEIRNDASIIHDNVGFSEKSPNIVLMVILQCDHDSIYIHVEFLCEREIRNSGHISVIVEKGLDISRFCCCVLCTWEK